MRKNLTAERTEAARRGLEFLYGRACDAESFDAFGHDFLFCLYTIASNSKDETLRRRARRMGRERARAWREEHREVPKKISAFDFSNLIVGSDAADRLGVRDADLKAQIRQEVKRFTATDFYGFDPTAEPPPGDVPDACECGADNPRGRKRCRRCKRPLEMIGRYGTWLDAMIMTYLGERYGIVVGARYKDVMKWRPIMLPYRGAENGKNSEYYWTVYAVTHIVYTLNHYNVYQLSPRWLKAEFEFLKTNLDEAIKREDPEMTSEFLDSLRALGMPDDNPLILRGTRYVLSQQDADGGWWEKNAENLYQRYHPAFTAINGLREIAWRGIGLSFPRLKPMLEEWADSV